MLTWEYILTNKNKRWIENLVTNIIKTDHLCDAYLQ